MKQESKLASTSVPTHVEHLCRAWTLFPDYQNENPSSTTYLLCDLGQPPNPSGPCFPICKVRVRTMCTLWNQGLDLMDIEFVPYSQIIVYIALLSKLFIIGELGVSHPRPY